MKRSILLLLFLVMGCQGVSVENMALIDSPSVEEVIVGQWIKASPAAEKECEQQYPNQLEFFDDGIYMISQADAENDDFYLRWQSGDYWFDEEGFLYIQSAMDAMLAYEVSLVDADAEVRLTFVDGEECEFVYIR